MSNTTPLEEFCKRHFVPVGEGAEGLLVTEVLDFVQQQFKASSVREMGYVLTRVFANLTVHRPRDQTQKRFAIQYKRFEVPDLVTIVINTVCKDYETLRRGVLWYGERLSAYLTVSMASRIFDTAIRRGIISYLDLCQLKIHQYHQYGQELPRSVTEVASLSKLRSKQSKQLKPQNIYNGIVKDLADKSRHAQEKPDQVKEKLEEERKELFDKLLNFQGDRRSQAFPWDDGAERYKPNKLDKHLIRLSFLYRGGIQEVLYLLFRTSTFKSMVQPAILQAAQQMVDQLTKTKSQEEIEANLLNEIQTFLDSRASLLIHTAGITRETYCTIRNILSSESRSEAHEAKPKGPERRKAIPLELAAPEIQQEIINIVRTKYSTGAHLGSGKDSWSNVIRLIAWQHSDSSDIRSCLLTNATQWGYHAKRVYLTQLQLSEQALTHIDIHCEKQNVQPSDVDWEAMSVELEEKGLIAAVEDSAFLVSQNYAYSRQLKRIIRRGRIKMGGYNIPALPPVEKVLNRLADNVLEGEMTLDDQQIVSLLNDREFVPYVGKEVTTDVPVTTKSKRKVTKKEWVRVLNIRFQLITIVKSLVDKKVLVPKERDVHLLVTDWQDAAPVMNWGLFALLVGVILILTFFRMRATLLSPQK
jgi:hypothetical protein